MSQTIQLIVNGMKPSYATALFAILLVALVGNGMSGMTAFSQDPQTNEESEFGFSSDDDYWGTDVSGDETKDDVDSSTSRTVNVPPKPSQTKSPAEVQAEQERQRREAAALRARPTPTDDGIQIIFTHRQQQPVTVDPNLKRAGENIVNNPQVYSEYHNPGGFQFRGIYGAWPQDEYLVDGGDDGPRAYIRSNGEMRGLDAEDTIVQYDTLDNRRLIEKSNRVHIYSPRFGSVRKIDGAGAFVEWQHYAGTQSRTRLADAQSRMQIGRTEQKATSDYARSNIVLRSANAGANTGTLGLRTSPMTYLNGEVTGSLSQLLTHATFSNTETAYLAEAKRAAVAWEGIDHLEITINEQTAQAMIGQKTPEAVFIVGEPETSPKLQLFKVASKETAQRGEIVEFMIRFDNVGSEAVGNVTIADSLTARLEYIEGSAGSSVAAEFFVEPNEVGSHILRWEITEPLHAGDFGVVRFRCRVQ